MLDAEQILKMIVGLKKVGDLDLIASESVVASTCKFEDRAKVVAMASIIGILLNEFDYELSPEFLSKIDGKSEELKAMERKLLTRDRRKQLAERFAHSLTQIVCSRDSYALIPPASYARLDELRNIAMSI